MDTRILANIRAAEENGHYPGAETVMREPTG
jgi:hypothetical protein